MQVIKDRAVIRYEIPEPSITLEPDTIVAENLESIQRAAALIFDFSDYLEGRPYSLAKQLRDRYQYTGDIVALGARKDNVAMIERCGVNVIAAHEKYTVEDLLPSFEEIPTHYQPNYPSNNAETAK